MRQALDRLIHYTGRNGVAGTCHVRVWFDDDAQGWLPVVVVGELDDNDGPSVTNAIEVIAPACDALVGVAHAEGGYVLVEYYVHDGRNPVWARVRLSHTLGRRWGEPNYHNPQWTALDHAEISALIGEPFPVDVPYTRASVGAA